MQKDSKIKLINKFTQARRNDKKAREAGLFELALLPIIKMFFGGNVNVCGCWIKQYLKRFCMISMTVAIATAN